MQKISGESYATYLASVAAGAQKHTQHTIIGDQVYTRVLRVAAWPDRPVDVGFLLRLHTMQLPQNVVLEVFYRYRMAVLEWNWRMNMKFRRLDLKIKTDQQPEPSEVKALDAMNKLREANFYSGSDLIDIWAYIVVRSIGDPATLDTICRRIQNDLKDIWTFVSPLIFEQQQAFRETFTLGRSEEDFLKVYPGRIVQSETVSVLYPCLAGSINDGQGVYFGHSVSTGCANFVNLKAGTENQNIVVLGASGEGKSTWQQSTIEGLRLDNFLVIVFDMNGEYRKVCEKTGGLYIDHTLSTGKYIDPLAIPDAIGIPAEDNSRLTVVSDALLTTVSILAEGISPGERNAADRALMKLYAKTGIDMDDPATWNFPEQPFDIEDWFVFLSKDKDKDAVGLASKLAIYFTGSKRHLFRYSDKITIPEDCNLVVFQVGVSLEGADAQVGAAKMAMTMSFVRDTLRKEKLLGKRFTAVVFDEAQRLLLNPEMSTYINSLATMIRHLNGLIIVATNKPYVFWRHSTGGEGGSGVWANSKYKIFFWLENSEIAAVEKNAEIPAEITETLKSMHLSRQFLIRHLDRGWDRCKVYLPPEEIKLYETRGLKKDE
ncbi:MAG: AAA-like domain protein [Pelotomaculum sp. PtaU1.Bin065]|nr:MAG: AAA-like domain protein [Pelotomaculum sp. PtaU1.Bin065]